MAQIPHESGSSRVNAVCRAVNEGQIHRILWHPEEPEEQGGIARMRIPMKVDRDSGMIVISSRCEATGSWILQKVIIRGGSPAGGNHVRVDLLHDRFTGVSAISF